MNGQSKPNNRLQASRRNSFNKNNTWFYGEAENVYNIDPENVGEPVVPFNTAPVSPGFGPNGDVTPSLPPADAPVSPGFGPNGDVMPSLPPANGPVSPGFGPGGNVTPSLPSRPNPNITVIPIIPSIISPAFLRFFNANGTGEPIDIFVNDRLVVRNLVFKAFSGYYSAVPGAYKITVYNSNSNTILFTTNIRLQSNYVYTASVSGLRGSQSLKLITSRRRYIDTNISYVRFINLAQNAPAMDVYVDGQLVISDIEYQEVSNYLTVVPGMHRIAIMTSGTNSVLYEEEEVLMEGNEYYGAYVVGNVNTRPVLQIVVESENV